MHIEYVGDSGKLRNPIYVMDTAPTSAPVDPRSIEFDPADCVEFHTDTNGFWKPSQVSLTPLINSACKTVSEQITTYDSFSKSHSMEFKVSLGATQKKFSGSVGYGTSRASTVKTSLETSRFLVETQCAEALYSLTVSTTKYTDAFKADVKGLPDSYSSAYESFVRTWGTHVVTGAIMGGRLRKSTSIETKECWKTSTSKVVESAEASFATANKEGSTEGQRSNAITQEKSASGQSTTVSWSSLGGVPALVENTLCTALWRSSTRPKAEMVEITTALMSDAVSGAAKENGDTITVATRKSDNVAEAVLAHMKSLNDEALKYGNYSSAPKVCEGKSSGSTNTHSPQMVITVLMMIGLMPLGNV
jgi:hypothetical protein